MPRIFITRIWPGSAIERLNGYEVDVWPEFEAPPRDVLLQRARGVDALITTLDDRIDAELLDAAGPSLKIVAQSAVGYNNIDLDAARQRGVWVTNTPGVLDEATADIAFALFMAAARRIAEGMDYVRAGKWTAWHPSLLLGADLHGATMGIVGLGRIGAAFARRCTGFDMKILYTGRKPRPLADAQGYEFRPLDDLLAESDFVSLHVPLTPETNNLMNRDRLRRMKQGAILINTARGQVVDTEALIEVLRDGHLAGAGLDVTDPEPLPADHPLLQLPNVVVTPHIGSASYRTRTTMIELAVGDTLAVLEGRQPVHPVVSVE